MSGRSFTQDAILRALPPGTVGLVEALVTAADEVGARILLVGGPVRDLLLERAVRDVDLVVEAEAGGDAAEAARAIAQRAAPEDARIVEHGRFGTLRIETADVAVDVAAARREAYARPGALPDVEPGTLEDDMARRDFSVNALAIALVPGGPRETQPVIDLVGGLDDLAKKRLRILHPRSLHDDPTRALRAARLAPRLGFALARSTRSALRDALRDGAFGAVSGDRLRRELEKCFTDAPLGLDPAVALRRLGDWHVLTALEPGLVLPRESVTALRRLGRAIADPPWRAPRYREWVTGMALWLAPLAPALRRRTVNRFAVRGDAARRITGFPRMRETTLRQLVRAHGRGAVDAVLQGVQEEELHALYAAAEPATRRRIERWAAEDRTRRIPVSGNELVALGLEGPAVGRVLARVRAAVLDGEVANREEAMALAEELARRSRAGGASRRSRRGARSRKKAAPSRSADPDGAGADDASGS
jgi:tRNA nucleotidyltransferase (CCA-adding enzyme)